MSKLTIDAMKEFLQGKEITVFDGQGLIQLEPESNTITTVVITGEGKEDWFLLGNYDSIEEAFSEIEKGI